MARVNLVLNPSFETNVSNWLAPTATAPSGTAAALQRGSGQTPIPEGSWYGYSSRTTAGRVNIQTNNMAVTANKTYTASVWMSRDGTDQMGLDIDWYDSSSTYISSSSTALTTPATNTWTRFNVTGVAPSNATSARVFCKALNLAVNANFRVDAVLFELGGLRDYVDGDTPSYEWSGTAHASTTVESSNWRRNLVANPSLEVDALDYSVGYTRTGVTNSALNRGTIAVPGLIGSYYGTINISATDDPTGADLVIRAGNIAVEPGVSYNFTANAQASGTVTCVAYLGIDWLDASGAQLSSGGSVTNNPTVSIQNGSFITLPTLTATAPNAAYYARPTIWYDSYDTTGTNRSLRWDALLFETNAQPTGSYFDGSFTSASWVNTANQSMSVLYVNPVRTGQGYASIGVSARMVGTAARKNTTNARLGVSGRVVGSKRAVNTSNARLGLTGRAASVKKGIGNGWSSSVGVRGDVVGKKKGTGTPNAQIGLSGQLGKPAPVPVYVDRPLPEDPLPMAQSRYIVQNILTGEWLHTDLPLSDDTVTTSLSGPCEIKGKIAPEIADLEVTVTQTIAVPHVTSEQVPIYKYTNASSTAADGTVTEMPAIVPTEEPIYVASDVNAVDVLARYGLKNAEAIVRGATNSGLSVARAAAMVQKESGGAMIWGHDGVNTGGAYTKGGPVTVANYWAYRKAYHAGKAGSQGCGICQLTYYSFYDQAEKLHPDGAADPTTNCQVGFNELKRLQNQYGVQGGARRYNGSGSAAEAYARDYMSKLSTWESRLAGADTIIVPAPPPAPVPTPPVVPLPIYTGYWRVAKCLDVLLLQFNAKYPKRSKASDGSIGDAAHAARDSDHNPYVGPASDGKKIVTARDYTHDPADGMDTYRIADELRQSHDPRIKYIISNGRIAAGNAGPQPWVWRPYSGSNKHDKHFHLSVLATQSSYDDLTPWDIPSLAGTGSPIPAPTPPLPVPAYATNFPTSYLDGMNKDSYYQFQSATPSWVTTVPEFTTGKAVQITLPPNGGQNPAPGAQPGTTAQRCELIPSLSAANIPGINTVISSGDAAWFGMVIKLGSTYPTTTNTWQLITQWKNDGTGSPPCELTIGNGMLRIGGNNGSWRINICPVTPGLVYRIQVGLTFTTVGSTSNINLIVNGTQYLTNVKPGAGLLYDGLNSYWKIGSYRNAEIRESSTIWIGAVCADVNGDKVASYLTGTVKGLSNSPVVPAPNPPPGSGVIIGYETKNIITYTYEKAVATQPLLRSWGHVIYLEIDGEIRAGAMITEDSYDQQTQTISCVGLSAYPINVAYQDNYRRYFADPLTVAQDMWNYVQGFPNGDLRVDVQRTSAVPAALYGANVNPVPGDNINGVKIAPTDSTKTDNDQPVYPVQPGDCIPQVFAALQQAGFVGRSLIDPTKGADEPGNVPPAGTIFVNKAGLERAYADYFLTPTSPRTLANPPDITSQFMVDPYKVNWWDVKTAGDIINDAIKACPADYVEQYDWNDKRVAVEHSLQLAYPRLGRQRAELRFVTGENIVSPPKLDNITDRFATCVVGIGAGDGSESLRETVEKVLPGRVRKTYVYRNASITDKTTLKQIITDELAKRSIDGYEISTIVVQTDNDNALFGTYNVGDDIYIQMETPHFGWVRQWGRILSITLAREAGLAELTLRRSDSFSYGQDIGNDPTPIDPTPPPITARPTLIQTLVAPYPGQNLRVLLSPTFTPEPGELLVVKTTNFIGTTSAVLLDYQGSGNLNWKLKVSNRSNDDITLAIYCATVGSKPGPMSVRATVSGLIGGQRLVVERWRNAQV